MNLASRIKKLEEKLSFKNGNVYFIGWKNCAWRESEGLIRYEIESIEEFKKRVLKKVRRRFIWVR